MVDQDRFEFASLIDGDCLVKGPDGGRCWDGTSVRRPFPMCAGIHARERRANQDRQRRSIGFEGCGFVRSALDEYPNQGIAKTGGAPCSAMRLLTFNWQYEPGAHKGSIPTSRLEHKGRIKFEGP
jgi:hypothetical protein